VSFAQNRTIVDKYPGYQPILYHSCMDTLQCGLIVKDFTVLHRYGGNTGTKAGTLNNFVFGGCLIRKNAI